jgi:hypothetical protein
MLRVLSGIMAAVCAVACVASAWAALSGSGKYSWLSVLEMLGGAVMFSAIALRGRRSFFR